MSATVGPRLLGMCTLAVLGGLAATGAGSPAQAGSLGVQTSTSLFVPWNRLAVSTVDEEARPAHPLTLLNRGASPLTISGMTVGASPEVATALAGREGDYDRAADFQFSGVPSLPMTLAPGESITLQVTFVPGRNATRPEGQVSHTTDGENYALLSVYTDDPQEPVTRIGLAGLDSVQYQGSDEPSVGEIVRSLGYGTDIGSNKHKIGSAPTLLGDELLSRYFLNATVGAPVEVWPLAIYSGGGTIPYGSVQIKAKVGFSGTTCKKSVLYNFPATIERSTGQNQKLAPLINISDMTVPPTEPLVGRVMTCPFQITHTSSSTDDALNDGAAHNWRIYPARDQRGVLIANSYIGISDPTPVTASAKNYDYQDGVFLFENVKPEDPAVDPATPGPVPGSASLTLDFSAAVVGTLADGGGSGTGFGSTQRNALDTFTAVASYDPSRLLLDTAAGTLTLTTTAGSSSGIKDNTLLNGLQTRFDGRTQAFAVQTTLKGPLGAIGTPKNQQAGIFLGPGQDDHVKLVLRANNVGTGSVELVQERRGSAVVVARAPVSATASIASLDLSLTADPATGVIAASFRKTSTTGVVGPVTALAETVTLQGFDYGHYFDPQSKAGIIAYNGTEPSFQAVFDRFAVVTAP